ncbi:MAG TPA: ImpA family metalloprotease [Solimonas sp.]|nr:ImpA family metalloprotease [Solimonas sp.]
MHARKLVILAAALVLSACGGGGSGDSAAAPSGTPSTDTSTPVTPPVTPGTDTPPPVTAQDRIDKALASGDSSGLLPEDRATLLERATRKAIELRARPQQVLADIYNSKGQVPDLSLSVGSGSSNSLASAGLTQAIPFIVSDDGSGIAAIREAGTGRGLAYGADVLSWMAGTTREQQHLPLFTRAFTWLMTGDADGALPATIKFSQSGYNSGVVKSFVTRLGKDTQEISCDIALPSNTCWRDADLLVFGAGVPDSAGLGDLVLSYLKAGKAVIYMNGGWWDSAGGNRVVGAMGMKLGGYPGNYFASAPTYSVSASRTAAESLARGDQLGKLVTTLQLLAKASYTHDFDADPAPIDGINLMRNDLSGYETVGKKIFAAAGELQRLLVLWADEWRPEVSYGAISRSSDAANFLRAYASDSWLAFNRTATTTNPKGQGDYMPAAAQQLAASTDFETIVLTLPQASGKTAIGRGALPAKAVALEIVYAPVDASFGWQTSYLRATGNPLRDNNYPRPRQPHSWALPLQRGTVNHFISPSGGPLFLNYSGATAGQKVTLRIKGVVKYAHFDFTNGTPPQAELDEAMAALQRQDYGWSTVKFRGGEGQQTVFSALRSFKDGMPAGQLRTPQDYVTARLEGILMDTNHTANGYNDMSMSARVSALCTSFSWDCSGSMHNAPGVQHFVSWIPQCGGGCSGQPIDSDNWGMGIGWGWAHELGHNTVQRWMSVVIDGKGCSTECDNNTLSSAHMLRRYAVLGEDASGANTDHAALYKMIQDNRATLKIGEAQRADMQARLWGGPEQRPMLAMYFQLAFLYTKTRAGLAKPTADAAIEFLTLLSKGGHLVANNWSTATAANYGMSRYPDNKIPNHELLYVLGSRIIGQDLRNIFFMYGVPLSQTALDSVADLGGSVATLQFYALAAGKANQLATGQWLSLSPAPTQPPAYPF